MNVTVAYYPVKDTEYGTVTVAVPAQCSLRQLKKRLLPALHKKGFLPAHASAHALPVALFALEAAPTFAELQTLPMDFHECDDPTANLCTTLPASRIHAVVFHPSMLSREPNGAPSSRNTPAVPSVRSDQVTIKPEPLSPTLPLRNLSEEPPSVQGSVRIKAEGLSKACFQSSSRRCQ
jgi:hypothetical protein